MTRTIPAEEGVAKATLSLMVSSAYNDMEAARLGLRTVLPEGTDIDLDVVDGTARIDLGEQVLQMADARPRANMVSAVVQTLTEFPTVERVSSWWAARSGTGSPLARRYPAPSSGAS